MVFEDVQILIVLSQSKSLSQAADRLFMSRPGLSQKIAQMEKSFGVKLIERTSSGIKMTREGKSVVTFARNVRDLEHMLEAHLAAMQESFAASINVGMSINEGQALLPRMVADFMKGNPDERIHLDAGYEPELIEKLRNGSLDFALVENQPPLPGIRLQTLGYSKLVFIGPNKPPYNQVVHPLPVETLMQWPMIIYEWNSGRHMVGNRHFRERYGTSLKDHNMIACFDTHEAMLEGARAGLGWTTVPRCIAVKCKNDPDLVRFKVGTPPMWYPVSLAWSTEGNMSDSARAFLDYVASHVPEGFFKKEADIYSAS